MFSKKWLAGVFALLLFAIPLHAQTATTETTLSAAITTPVQDSITVTSATNMAANQFLWIAGANGGELVRIKSTYSSGTTIPVLRNQGGKVAPHLSGEKIIVGRDSPKLGVFTPASGTQTGGVTSGIFLVTTPYGVCTPASQQFTVMVNVNTGDRVSCVGDTFSIIGGPNSQVKIVTAYALTATIANVDSTFFVADRPYKVVGVSEIHNTIEDSASSWDLKKDTSTNAPGAGSSLLASTFDLTATTRVVQNGTLTSTASRLHLAAGDRLAWDATGTIDTVVGVIMSVSLVPE